MVIPGSWNRGKGRKIPRDEVHLDLKVHRSVKTRLEGIQRLGGLAYVPHVRPHTGKNSEPVRLSYREWNIENPVHWTWVD